MLDKVKDLIRRPTCHTITFEYHSYGSIIVVCTVNRIYHKHLGVEAVMGSDEEALDDALSLLTEVQALEEKIGHPIVCPPLEKQRFDKGYYREKIVDDWHVEFKRHGETFVITGVYQQDEHGFTIAKELREVTGEGCGRIFQVTTQEQAEHFRDNLEEVKTLWLKDGEELWAWDDIALAVLGQRIPDRKGW
jgi:hypothetical protein